MKYETIQLEMRGQVCVLTLNRPDRLNALTVETAIDFKAAVADAVQQGARAIVLTGAGRAFCAGGDLRAMQEIAMRAILSRPLVYARHVAENVFDILMADTSKADETLERHWRLWEEVSWNRQPLRRYVELPTPAQEAAYPALAALDGIYHPARFAAPMLLLFVL